MEHGMRGVPANTSCWKNEGFCVSVSGLVSQTRSWGRPYTQEYLGYSNLLECGERT